MGTIFPFFFCLTISRYTRKYSIKILKEIDVNPITGGEKRLVLGGVITLAYCIIQFCMTGGLIVKYFLFNERVEATELTNISNQNSLPESYMISLTIFSSFIFEDATSLLNNQEDIGPFDLCDMSIMKIGYSSYFSQAYHKNITCHRKRLSSYTDQFDISIKLDELSLADPTGAYITVKFKSEQNRVIHFFNWQFKSVWSDTIEHSTGSYSMAKGMVIPQTLYSDNWNMTSAFRGPDPTSISLDLTPTFYSDEINAAIYKGYRVQARTTKRGSVVNERTLTNLYTNDGRLSEDFSIKFDTYVSMNVYNVRVIRLRTVIDVLAQNLGLLAGLAFICRFAKFLLMKCNIWLHLDREYNIHFKEDKRLSVTLNPPKKKVKGDETRDYWEPNYIYSNKNVLVDENGQKLKTFEPTEGFAASTANMHQRSVPRKSTFNEESKHGSGLKYQEMEEEDEPQDPDLENAPDPKND